MLATRHAEEHHKRQQQQRQDIIYNALHRIELIALIALHCIELHHCLIALRCIALIALLCIALGHVWNLLWGIPKSANGP